MTGLFPKENIGVCEWYADLSVANTVFAIDISDVYVSIYHVSVAGFEGETDKIVRIDENDGNAR